MRNTRVHIAQQQKVHDRTSAVIPHNAKYFIDEVDDAYDTGGASASYDPQRREWIAAKPRVTVIRSMRSDPLAALKAQGAIDEVQFLAGQIWERCYRTAHESTLKAIDPTREGVDGGRLADPLNDGVKRAIGQLRKAETALGRDGHALVIDVIGKGLTLAKASDARGLMSRSGREYIGRRFRECLDCLAEVFGCATPSVPQATSHNILTPPR